MLWCTFFQHTAGPALRVAHPSGACTSLWCCNAWLCSPVRHGRRIAPIARATRQMRAEKQQNRLSWRWPSFFFCLGAPCWTRISQSTHGSETTIDILISWLCVGWHGGSVFRVITHRWLSLLVTQEIVCTCMWLYLRCKKSYSWKKGRKSCTLILAPRKPFATFQPKVGVWSGNTWSLLVAWWRPTWGQNKLTESKIQCLGVFWLFVFFQYVCSLNNIIIRQDSMCMTFRQNIWKRQDRKKEKREGVQCLF